MWAGVIHIDVVKSRIQSDNPLNPRYGVFFETPIHDTCHHICVFVSRYRGMLDCFRQCYIEGGIRIFFRGFTICCLRAFPTNGATFLGYYY